MKNIIFFTLLCFTTIAYATDDKNTTGQAEESWKADFGLSLGVGISAPSEKNITDTTVSNGIVRVTGEQEYIPELWLTTNWTCETCFSKYLTHTRPGLFIGLGSNTNQGVFSSVATGAMFSFLRNKQSAQKNGTAKPAFNIGLGYSIQKVKVLGNGVKEDAPLPVGEESIRFKDKYTHGPMLMFSFSVF